VQDVLIFGEGMPYAGALLFRSKEATDMPDRALVDKIWSNVSHLNQGNQSHANVSKEMLVPMRYSSAPLEKSSKGTVMRRQAFQKYSAHIAAAYDGPQMEAVREIGDDKIEAAILDDVNAVLSSRPIGFEELSTNSDLFASGVDSVASIRIRQALTKYLSSSQQKLPRTLVEDCGTVAKIAEAIISVRHGRAYESEKSLVQQMRELLDQHSQLSHFKSSEIVCKSHGSVRKVRVLLTGPTGFLGSHLLHQLLHNSNVGHVYLLVRGASQHAARERVLNALKCRRLNVPTEFDSMVTILPCKLSSPHLCLSPNEYQILINNVDVIAHLAWAVNFLLPLKAFTSHLKSLQNLLSLAVSSTKPEPIRFIFCSTVAAVSQHPHPIPEGLIGDPVSASTTGYGRSKWVAEQMCLLAAQSSRLKDRISIVRVGQLSGATDTGIWASSEAYPLIMSTYRELECLPDLDGARASQSQDGSGKEVLSWLPVDVAGKAFAELVMGGEGLSSGVRVEESGIKVYHLVSPCSSESKSWSDFISIVSKAESKPVRLVRVAEWLDRVEDLRSYDATKDHQAVSLLSFWREAYCKTGSENDVPVEAEADSCAAKKPDENIVSGGFQMMRTLRSIPSLKEAAGLNEEYYQKVWCWVQRSTGKDRMA
jgi:thioester reductase-like protein